MTAAAHDTGAKTRELRNRSRLGLGKFMLTYVVVLAVPLLGFLFLYRFSTLDLARRNTEMDLDSAISEIALSLENEFAQLENLVLHVTVSGDFTRPNLENPAALISIQRRLRSVVTANDFINDMAYIPLTSDHVCTSLSPRYPEDFYLSLAGDGAGFRRRTAGDVARH